MVKMLLSVVMSLVPLRYRRAWFHDVDVNVTRGAQISAFLQSLGGAALIAGRYIWYLIHRQAMLEQMAGAKTEYDQIELAYRGVSSVTFIEYLILPGTMLLIYVAVEGTIRMFAIIVSGEILPTLPLAILSWMHIGAEARYKEHKLGPRVADEMTVGTSTEFDLRIDSCRRKRWNKLTTINYNDELYEIVKEFPGEPPRPHIYLLKRIPGGKVVRGIYHYDPTETLSKEEK
jgi:hypothetical protein